MSHEASQPPSPSAPSAPAAAGAGAAPAQLLERCWKLLDSGVLAQAGQVFAEVNQSLSRSADVEALRVARDLNVQGKALQNAYYAAVRVQHERAVKQFLAPHGPGRGAGAPGLALMSMEEGDLSNQVEHASSRLRELVKEPWTALVRRLQGLAGNEVPEAEIALRPGLFLHAVAEDMELSRESAAALARSLPVALAPLLGPAYLAIDELLAGAGVEARAAVRAAPVLRSAPPTLQRSLPPTIHRDASGRLEDPLLGLDEGAVAPAVRRAARPELAIAHEIPEVQPDAWGLREYVRLQALAGVNATVLFDTAADRLYAGAASGPVRDAPSRALIGAMIAGQKLDAEWLALPERAGGGGDEDGVPAGTGTRDYSRRLIGLAALPLHKHTVQLVARIFARIERDPLLPAPVRALIVALRFPFLEAALADPSIFLDAGRPARLLVNALASAAIDGAAQAGAERPHWAQMRAAVQYVLGSPGAATASFAKAQSHFADYLAAAPSAPGQAAAAAALEALQLAEAREVRGLALGAFLRELLAGAPLDPLLRRFVTRDWARVLAEVEDDAGDGGEQARLLGVVPDLVWSVLPVRGAADRKRFGEIVPTLLERLRDGVQRIGWSGSRFKGLIEHLQQAHTQALAAGESAAAQAEFFSVSTLRIRLDGLRLASVPPLVQLKPFELVEEAVHHVLEAQGSGVAHRRVSGDPASATLDEAQAESRIERWRPGQWFDLRIGRHLLRVRLEGQTATRALSLLRIASGTEGAPLSGLLSLSHASLVACVRHGWMVPVEPVPLVGRAFRTVLADLQRSVQATPEGPARGP